MYSILLNVLRSRRSAGRRSVSLDAAARVPSPAASPDDLAESADDVRVAQAHLRALPPRQREIVVLHYIDSLSYREIADALGVSVGTVKQSIFRARTTLRAALNGNHAERTVEHGLP
jgi:RNA polymerase sigma-70 factor (ECF subfamily)